MTGFLQKIYWVLSAQFGIDVRRFLLSCRGIASYIGDWIRFRKKYRGTLTLLPCLHDRYEEGGSTKSEYFWQDLFVAQKIYAMKPKRHVDIGSRIDGFVAHVASFREIEIFDIRPISASIPGVVFRQADLMASDVPFKDCCDSLSCLHALEHFGLGRYGDPIDPMGYVAGFSNMTEILKSGGVLYLSVPIGRERVEFNAHRVFDPRSLVRLAEARRLQLKEFAWIGSEKAVKQSIDYAQDMDALSKLDYALGIFTFVKQ